MKEKRDEIIILRTTKAEKNRIYEKMLSMGIRSLSAYIRKMALDGYQPYQKKPPKEQPFQLLVDIQGKMAEGKSVGYKKWATKFNLKEMSKTLLFLQEQKISSADELRERAAAATERYHAMGDSIKAAETRLAEIAMPRFASWYPPSIWKAI